MLHFLMQCNSVELLQLGVFSQYPWDDEINRKCFETGQELFMNNIRRVFVNFQQSLSAAELVLTLPSDLWRKRYKLAISREFLFS